MTVNISNAKNVNAYFLYSIESY